MLFINSKTIRLDRLLSNLDKFALDFISILRKHTDYVIVSGYVAILFGRSRTTEDVDVIIPKMARAAFSAFFKEVTKNGYWFLNSSKEEDLWEYLTDKVAIRAAEDGQTIPNIEIKFAKTQSDQVSLANKLKVRLGSKELLIAPLELQILYKEKVLKSPKDMEDAKHLRLVFGKFLKPEAFKSYERVLCER